jgi:hypothetical protein
MMAESAERLTVESWVRSSEKNGLMNLIRPFQILKAS